jgi:hypothetical protein
MFGRATNLAHLEHQILHVEFDEPRVHFGVVCAARGCPPLRDEAYTASRLDRQLAAKGEIFLADSNRNRVEVKRRLLYHSPIFKWFQEDFSRGAGSVVKFVAPSLSAQVKKELDKGGFRIKYTDYDWSLNDLGAK